MNIVLYHGNCPDGAGAAWVAKKALGNDTLLLPGIYGEPLPFDVKALKSVDNVYVLDYSLNRELLLEINSRVGKLVLLDHHKTAEADLQDLPFCTFDMYKSGAMLAWEYFFPEQEPPLFIEYIQDRDLWLFKYGDNARGFHSWFVENNLDWTILDNYYTHPNDLMYAVEQGENWNKHNEMIIKRIVKTAGLGVLNKIPVSAIPIVNSNVMWSDIAGELCKDAPFAVVWREDSHGTFVYSLRSSAANPSHMDVSAIAKLYGGGGHKHAAGFVSKTLVHQYC